MKGAFTGAQTNRAGYFELADGGTLFLDEVGDLSDAAQAKLLRVLETRALRRVGAAKETEVEVRVVAATNRSLEQMVATGSFRSDLFYRLNLFGIELTPLRETARRHSHPRQTLLGGSQPRTVRSGCGIFASCRRDPERIRLSPQRPRATEPRGAGGNSLRRRGNPSGAPQPSTDGTRNPLPGTRLPPNEPQSSTRWRKRSGTVAERRRSSTCRTPPCDTRWANCRLSETLLIVEDEAIVAADLKATLERSGYTVLGPGGIRGGPPLK